MIDIYGLSIFSAFFAEISFITGNIINYLSNTKFYGIISGFLGYKFETPKTRMGSIDKSSTGNQESYKIVERFNKIVDKPIIEDTPFYYNKYVIWGTFFVTFGCNLLLFWWRN